MDLQQLQGVLAYKRQILEQFLAVASIFGGFAVTGIIALRTETPRDRATSVAFGAMAVAAMAFIFATALDAIWLPVSNLSSINSVPRLQTVLAVGDSVVWAILLGATSLLTAVGLLGYARSRRMGWFVLALAIAAAATFAWNLLRLFQS